ncbi:nucleoid-associated protein [Variovorax sp. W2I14]|uniref:nucleoid-associated protein n=1 Tax=Variovorax sp. W2I14 TaxID=3042290 RepID=UPI003D1ED1C7
MDLQFLTINRAVLFDIPPDLPNKSPGVPVGGQALVGLSASAKTMVTKRLASALGKNANGMEISVTNSAAGSFFQIACSALDGNDTNFLNQSNTLASMLAVAQNNKHLAHCKLMVMQGTVTAGQLPFLVAVKAELQDGLADRSTVGAQPSLQHLKDIFMTESQRLFKIGYLYRTVAQASVNNSIYHPNEHVVHLFDHLMTSTETRNAAFYFYNGFLGCNTASSAKARTRDFYENTLTFIKDCGLPPDKRLDLIEALRADLRSNSNTLNVIDFANSHMTPPVKSAYETFMIQHKGFPNHAVQKDLEYVQTKLKRRRKITFSSGISLSSPPELMTSITVTPNTDGSTTVQVPGTVEARE